MNCSNHLGFGNELQFKSLRSGEGLLNRIFKSGPYHVLLSLSTVLQNVPVNNTLNYKAFKIKMLGKNVHRAAVLRAKPTTHFSG